MARSRDLRRMEQTLGPGGAQQRELASSINRRSPRLQTRTRSTARNRHGHRRGGRGNRGRGRAAGGADPPPLKLDQLTDEQLHERVERLDRAIGRSRMLLMRRYVETDRALGNVEPRRTTPPKQTRRPQTKPRRPAPPKRKRPEPHVKDLQNASTSSVEVPRDSHRSCDGVAGPATKKRLRRVKYYLGYRGAEQRSTAYTPELLRHIAHPRSPRHANPAKLARALARRRKQHKLAAKAAAPAAGVATFDGKPVAAWMKPYLDWARAHGWQGTLNSGYRTPEYSEHLCRGIAGHRSVRKVRRPQLHHPSRQAGGSIDVSDYVRFGELMRQCPYSPRISSTCQATEFPSRARATDAARTLSGLSRKQSQAAARSRRDGTATTRSRWTFDARADRTRVRAHFIRTFRATSAITSPLSAAQTGERAMSWRESDLS